MSNKPSSFRPRQLIGVGTPVSTTTEPHHNIEAELSTIGGLILDNTAWRDVSAIVQAGDFYDEKNRLLFGAIKTLADAGRPFDTVTMIDELERDSKLADAGGATWLGHTLRDTPSAANVRFYAAIVRRKSLERRRNAAIAREDHDYAAAITAAIKELESRNHGKTRFISIKELCTTPPVENWLVKGYVPTDSLGVWFGDPEAGKSFLLIDLACHIATGRPWRGQPVKQGAVAYIAGEGRNGLAKRFKAWCEYHGIDEPSNVYLLTTPIQLTDPASVGAVLEEIKLLPHMPSLLIIDTVNRNFGQGDENATGDMTLAVAGLDAMRTATGATVIGSHHCGLTAKDRGRGSSVLRASLDFEFGVERSDRTVQIRCTKAKDFDHPAPLAWTFEQQTLPWADEEGTPINSAVLIPTDVVSRQSSAPMGKHECVLYAILESQGPMLTGDWRAAFYDRTRKGAPGTEYNTLKTAWKRAKRILLTRGLVTEKDGRVSIPEGGTNGPCTPDVPGNQGTGTDSAYTPDVSHDGGTKGTCTPFVPLVPGITEGVQRVHTPIGVYPCTPNVPRTCDDSKDLPDNAELHNDCTDPPATDGPPDYGTNDDSYFASMPEFQCVTALRSASETQATPPPAADCRQCGRLAAKARHCHAVNAYCDPYLEPACGGRHFQPKESIA